MENVRKAGKKKAKQKEVDRVPLKHIDGNPEDDHSEEEGKPTIEQVYQKKSQVEHILLRPDTYVGSIEPVTQTMWVYDDVSEKMESRTITYIPGLYKIFDEILVNAADNKQRDSTMDTLKVSIDAEAGTVSVWNNGKGIPVVEHKEHKCYVPELIFGHLLTGSNFNDKKKKTTGGRNGYGAKLTNIFSKKFVIETGSSEHGKCYKQVFESNMSVKNPPTIRSYSKSDYTCVTFTPDLDRFGMETLEKDIISLFQKRVLDIAGTTTGKLKVYLNDKRLQVNSFQKYVELYQSSNSESKVLFDAPVEGGRWRVAVGVSEDGFQQVSFVNSIATSKGGSHVNYIVDQVIGSLNNVVKKKNKGDPVKPAYIKQHVFVFVSALIENPAFDSQTKENLTTKASKFGSKFTISDKFAKQIVKSDIVEKIMSYTKFKQNAELKRKGGAKQRKLTGITKLDDANFAGGAKGKDCTLILTEGDSAKALAMSGLGVVGRDYYGVFPLKGKLLNVRDAKTSQIKKNEEIINIVKILGLQMGVKCDSVKSLRYGHLMIMADQDHDGSHIKGLVINFIHHFWPELLQVEGFMQEFITPIVKATKGKNSHTFYTLPEYEEWKERIENEKGWSIKYYKGLGTSTAKEAKEYFSHLETHQIDFSYSNEVDGDVIDMAFAKDRVADRKTWLSGYVPGSHVDYDVDSMAYENFVNKELILFSVADNARSIPCFVDGFKPSQRKVLFSCFKRNLKNEIKVAQLAGYVSEHSSYHHGEMSLNGTIVNMAQDFVGSNNINVLTPGGQFGTRLLGGKDAASPRYVFTKLESIARCLFNPLDDPVLTYMEDDGQSIEPKWYVPIIPMVLVNGCEGIGTGWSTSIPNYNPRDIIANLRLLISGEEMELMTPWYRGYGGTIEAKDATNSSFTTSGKFEEIADDTIRVTELPIKSWTSSYKQFLEDMLVAKDPIIKDFSENHTDVTVDFTIKFVEGALSKVEKEKGGIEKKMKLISSLSTTNMNLFDPEGRMKKYSSPLQIIQEFAPLRVDFYNKRKTYLLKKLKAEQECLENKVRFIEEVISEKLIVYNRKKADILDDLQEHGFQLIFPQKKSSETEGEVDEEQSASAGDLSRGYDYLLSMKIWSLTNEKIEKLKAEYESKCFEHDELEETTVETFWLNDLNELDAHLLEMDEMDQEQENSRLKASKKKPRQRKKKAKNSDNENDDGSDYEPVKRVPQKKKPAPAKPVAAKKAPAKKVTAPKKSIPKPESNSDEEVMSLSQRMAKRLQVTPKKPESQNNRLAEPESTSEDDIFVKPKASKGTKATSAAAAVSKKFNSMEISASPLPKKSKKTFLKRRKVKTPTKNATGYSRVKSPYRVSPDKKKQRTKVKKKPVVTESNEDDASDDALMQEKVAAVVSAATRAPRRTAAAKKVIYVPDSSEEDNAAAGENSGDEDDFSSDFSEEEDDESDFED